MSTEESWAYSQWKHPLNCPYCGTEMHFYWDIYYEGSIQEWECRECGLILPDLKRFPPKFLASKRDQWRAELYTRMKEAYKKYEQIKRDYDTYGKNNPSMRNPPLVKP